MSADARPRDAFVHHNRKSFGMISKLSLHSQARRERELSIRVRPTPPIHPRVCGEQPHSFPCARRIRGSSPRVRGTGGEPDTDVVFRRLIPACAGNSRPWSPAYGQGAVHPRVCGEQSEIHASGSRLPGSSPRVRGTVDLGRAQVAMVRFIPACAGNSIPTRPARARVSVHPRVCGEQARIRASTACRPGSSPRVRGTELFAIFSRPFHRFIPACAGNSRPPSACW